MIVETVKLINFRNYEAAGVDWSAGLNVLTGENAAGKTNLLESIYLFGVGKSARAVREREMIKSGCEFARLKAVIQGKHRKYVIEIQIDKSDSKKITVDGLPISRLSELLGIANVVFFNPDDLRLIVDAPADRRRFMDISLAQQSKVYYANLNRYNKALAARNKLLRDTVQGSRFKAQSSKSESQSGGNQDLLAAFELELAKGAAYITAERKKFIDKINELAQPAHNKLSGGKEKLKIEYESRTGVISEKDFITLFENSRTKDIEQQQTTAGPHRDDIAVSIDGADVKKYGSRGQQRSACLSMKLAETELFKILTDEYPVLLLDDVFSELDAGRRLRLLEAVSGIQTVITCTEFSGKAEKILNVRNGNITWIT